MGRKIKSFPFVKQVRQIDTTCNGGGTVNRRKSAKESNYNEIFLEKGNHIRQVSIMCMCLLWVCLMLCALHVILPRIQANTHERHFRFVVRSVFWHQKTKGNESFSHAVNFFIYISCLSIYMTHHLFMMWLAQLQALSGQIRCIVVLICFGLLCACCEFFCCCLSILYLLEKFFEIYTLR